MDLSYYTYTQFAMSTGIELKVAAGSLKEAEEIQKKTMTAIQSLEQNMSYFLADSSVSKINLSAGGSPVKIDSDTYHVIKTAMKYYKLSQGAFDITSAPLTALWRNSIKNQLLPSDQSIRSLLADINGSGVMLDDDNGTVGLSKNQSIDLGGIGKGYAADIALKTCRECGVKSAFINIGGNVHTLGHKITGEPWTIGIQNPRRERGDLIAALMIADQSAVTSGDYERCFIENNKRYHHIIDPKTGYPVESDLMGATVVARSSLEADAMSTAVFVSGLECGMNLLKQSQGFEGVLITKEKKVYITSGLKDCFISSNQATDYEFKLC